MEKIPKLFSSEVVTPKEIAKVVAETEKSNLPLYSTRALTSRQLFDNRQAHKNIKNKQTEQNLNNVPLVKSKVSVTQNSEGVRQTLVYETPTISNEDTSVNRKKEV